MTSTPDLAAALSVALRDQDTTAIGPLLADGVRWESCLGKAAVLEEIDAAASAGMEFAHVEITELADRFVVDLFLPDEMGAIHLAVFTHDGQVVEIRALNLDSHDAAASVAPAAPPARPSKRARLDSLAVVFPVRDTVAACAHYERLGFAVHSYDDGATYAFAERAGVHLHLSRVDELDPLANLSAAYLYVDDADRLYAEWANAGLIGRLHAPESTDYGMREGAHVDPDGNLLRFGSAN